MWNVQSGECTQNSAKMGKEEGTHEGANLGATPENDTQKIDQPTRRNSTILVEGRAVTRHVGKRLSRTRARCRNVMRFPGRRFTASS
jgi:hypothetical protein